MEIKMEVKAEEFLNCTKLQAQNKAEAKNMIFRLISKDGEEFLPWPTDQRTDRVCVEVVKGLVVKSVIC